MIVETEEKEADGWEPATMADINGGSRGRQVMATFAVNPSCLAKIVPGLEVFSPLEHQL